MYENLIVKDCDGVAVVMMNRPDVRNAINSKMQAELHSVVTLAGEDDRVRAVVFTGAGDRAFAAGADIESLRDYTSETAIQSRMQRLFDDIEALNKPTIAAINGHALGGGCELAMACDIRIASQTARFGLPETNLAILPGAGGTQRLARLIGPGRALDMILTGRIMSAGEALETGLVSRVVPNADLLVAAKETAATIMAKGPLAIRLAKLVVRAGVDVDSRSGLMMERLAQALLYNSDDKREGVEAFLAKRPPSFTGK
ncbi:MAG: enoyl-CoA hydratase-related protein [Actinomycetota bacterium]|uniref:Enoyl-CoA hydratase-related protein n=1 Tax=Mycobacterium lentiflavum TaxID=141349 RepID=A0ABY3UPN8_MYCLN|nr:enoyl-CoA hydratase-related protein [Mycobacterium lentiflavum]MEE3062674.1 enoyl-CoA hydratase-related protein [Actinomycetota bacterium]ULP41543.1 enoyl-CoA hydratase-related protein [Mycobacterium lentiflavum]